MDSTMSNGPDFDVTATGDFLGGHRSRNGRDDFYHMVCVSGDRLLEDV